jgi:hypothetical protein
MAKISLIKMEMVFAIIIRMQDKGKEIPMAAEWEISIVMDKVMEIAAEVDVETSTGMVGGTKMYLLKNHRNQTTIISKLTFNEEARLFLIFGSILAFFLFSK